jgi:PAS domain S-box-containing protein
MHNWIKVFPAAITVCDPNGIIVELNNKSCKTFEKDGGEKLIGQNLIDCHPEPAKSQLKEMLEKQNSNVYTIKKTGRKNSYTSLIGLKTESLKIWLKFPLKYLPR